MPKKVSQKEIKTPVFTDDFVGGASIQNYIVLPEKAEDGTLKLYILYTHNKKAYKLTSFFEFDDCKSEVDVRHPFLGKNTYVKLPNFKVQMSYMKSLTTGGALSVISGSGKEILLLEKTMLHSHSMKSLQTDLYKTHYPFFYEDLQHSFFISPPSMNRTMGKSPSFAKSSILRSGTNTLQDSAYRLLPDSVKEEDPNSLPLQFTNSDVVNRSFYKSGDASQVIVRVKEKVGLNAMNSAQISFGVSPIQNKNTLSQLKIKMVIDVNGYTFYPFYHPYTCLFLKQLNRYGITGLLDPDAKSQDGKELLHQSTPSQMNGLDFKEKYKPNFSETNWSNVKEEIDFKHGGVYSTYNWELFYHIPLFIATRLSQDQRFDEAQDWFHYIFDPTEPKGETPYRFWKIKPFHTYTIAAMKKDMEALLKGGDAVKKQIKAWEENPFNPHLLARFRRLAYMKTVVMKYLDNLIAWGDQLFRMDSIESLNEATQLYVLGGQILGKLPVETEAKPRKSKSFNELAAQLTEMGNAWINLENSMTDEYEEEIEAVSSIKDVARYHKDSIAGKLRKPKIKEVGNGATTGILDDILYFCMSPNEKLLSYWDTVADRLFKIRNCMNIEGLIRNVPLFQPPIDPALLVKAAAAGVDISCAINDLYAPMPVYRFQILVQKAQELCQELKSLGGSLLSALEKKDAEQLSLIKSQHEIQLLEANKDIKKHQIEEARLSVLSLEESYKIAQIRFDNYSDRDFINPAEVVSMALSTGATVMQVISAATATAASAASQVPDIEISTHVQGMSSGTSVKIHPPASGRKNVESAMSISKMFDMLGMILRETSSNVSTVAGYERRMEEWDLQIDLAEQEMKQIDKQILGALIRKEIAAKDKENLELQIENIKQADTFMRNKYTNQELYSWLIGQITSVYFQTYKMAYDMAKQAEKAFRFELGTENSNFIQFGYWDNLKKGLLSGEKLYHDLARLELAYLEKNKRDYEITKHVSLAQLDPLALLRLRFAGSCDFEIPEVLYDMDYPGQYFRRFKSVSVSIPCIVGPYTSVSATLSLLKHKYRKSTNPDNSAGTGYAEDPGNDERMAYNIGAIQSIAISYAQNDSGMFELNFRDERYLPFEGAGASSSWRLELPTEVKHFDYSTISDVIVHVKYTAREGGSGLKAAANAALKDQLEVFKQDLSQNGLHMAINMKYDLPNEWQVLKKNGKIDITIDKSRLPYMAQTADTKIENVMFVAKVKDNPATFTITVDGNMPPTNLVRIEEWKLCRGDNTDIELDTSFELSVAPAQLNNLEDLMMVVKYSFS